MIVCHDCCKSCRLRPCDKMPSGWTGMTCDICGKSSGVSMYHCDRYDPETKPNRFLNLLRPVAEVLADREAKYGGVYQELRKDEGSTGFLWEVGKKLYRYRKAMDRGNLDVAFDSVLDIAGYCVLEMEVLKEYMEGQPIRAKLRVEKAVPKIVAPEEYRKEGTD